MSDQPSPTEQILEHLPASGAGSVAPMPRRIGALLIDGILSTLLALAIARPPGFWSSVVLVAEYTVFTGLFAQTPGMRLAGLACVRVSTNGPLGLGRALVRAVLLQLLVPAVFLDSHRRGYHDKAADSIVVCTS